MKDNLDKLFVPVWIKNTYEAYRNNEISKEELLEIFERNFVGCEEIACTVSNLILNNRMDNFKLVTFTRTPFGVLLA